ncbi:tRNA (guanine(9)-N1)-methyltransferase [Amaranthus tricolor]|uniref:tRNA (guanine(9)-N1)-methyltransferase n=1 Tax=Amaranthus tricolor TaxID=29722 RepID=UPI002585C2A8|nr:tRNA (guanine(9)-N1)-methyltransferase [Amaranthus tricolor]XP_057516871.1 tRNA (guanine(9)-N1)-methyltransferase [Amaranthus tricolor]
MEEASNEPNMAAIAEKPSSDSISTSPIPQTLSKTAQKKLMKQQRFEAKKAEKKAQAKEHKRREKERKQKEWEEMLSKVSSEEEKLKIIETRRAVRKERMEKRSEEKGQKLERLSWAKLHGQKIVIDLEFSHLMTPNELHSLVQQIMYCYAVNGRCTSPSHLWLTGCEGIMGTHLKRIPGFDKWIIEKENQSYIEAFHDQKENLVYLTADAETVLDDLDPKKIYIIGGLVDRNRWKGLTMKKAEEQGIQAAKLPIGTYLKMSSSQVLTVNQVVEILLKYLEIRDWKTSFFQVIPQRKRYEADTDDQDKELEHEGGTENDSCADSQKKLKLSDIELEPSESDRLGEVSEPEATEKAVECDKSEDDKN